MTMLRFSRSAFFDVGQHGDVLTANCESARDPLRRDDVRSNDRRRTILAPHPWLGRRPLSEVKMTGKALTPESTTGISIPRNAATEFSNAAGAVQGRVPSAIRTTAQGWRHRLGLLASATSTDRAASRRRSRALARYSRGAPVTPRPASVAPTQSLTPDFERNSRSSFDSPSVPSLTVSVETISS